MDFAFGVLVLVLGYTFVYVAGANLTGTPGEGPGFFESLGVPGADKIQPPSGDNSGNPTGGNQTGQTPAQPNKSPIPGYLPGQVIV